MTNHASATADREIATTRVFDAPREIVFQMWTDPEHIVKWWGPRGFTNTIHEMDVRPGGAWRHIMHGPDGTDYPNEGVYLEVIAPERLVYRHTATPQFVATVIFDVHGKKTMIHMQMLFETAEIRNKTVETFRAVEGQQQTLDRLKEQLQQRLQHIS